MAKALALKGSKRLLHAWAFYDWANSVYSLTVVSAIFPLYLGALFRLEGVEEVAFLGGSIARTPLISYVTAAAFVVIAIITPLLSGIADYLGNKKVFMKFFCYLGGVACMGLYWFTLDNLLWGLFFYFLGVIGFWVSYAMNNSYLPDIAFPEQQDRVSARGFSLGYIGSVILLLLNLSMVLNPGLFGIADHPEQPAAILAMKYSFVSVGIWWIAFSQYSFYYLPKGNRREGARSHIIFNGFRELRSVWQQLKHTRALKRYLGAFFVYSMAVQTVMLIAAYFGESEIAWGSDDERTLGLIGSILIIQLVAVLGATLTAKASRAYGNIRTLVVINFLWVLICIYAFFVRQPVEFYVAAACVGMVMGGIQALSRSTYSKMLPETQDTTSFFSFYDVAEKIGIVIGMSIFALVSQWNNSMRPAALMLGVFFLLGIFLLLRVREQK
ncbi:MFS transporter [Robiginitalea sp. M366]|uniref:MFS transporter n=1 Tax=Robiginitalea aestuariiviva TaxID=3036903 RepID=UPI00240E775C|nr:MFS transporter [Robiginitalea aestuariiviva]MDG1572593.1 MFS transporter [Robiginitalea aestuariiviva]